MKIYVGNLPYSAQDADLEATFAPFGTVTSATVMMERDNPSRSRGFGFIEMDDAGAQAAIEQLNGKDLDGRALVVNEARPMTERPPRTGGFRGGNSGGGRGGYSNDRGGYGGGRDRY